MCGRRPYKLRKEAWVPLCSLSPDAQWTSVLEILGMPAPSGQVHGRGWHRLSRAGVGRTPGAVAQLTPQCGRQGARASVRPCSVTLRRVVGQPMVGAQVGI